MSETTPKQSMEADVERRQQQAHVLSLHDAVVEIKATLNNGLKTTVLGPQGRAKSRQKNVQSIRDWACSALRAVLTVPVLLSRMFRSGRPAAQSGARSP